MSGNPVIFWFRRDLRLADNPAWNVAAASGPVLPVYILDPAEGGDFAPGAASRVWLHHSLTALNHSLDGKLHVVTGDPGRVLPELMRRVGATRLFRNQVFEKWHMKRDHSVDSVLQAEGLSVHEGPGNLLWDPEETVKEDGAPFKVFTPFWRCRLLDPNQPGKPVQRAAADICVFDELGRVADAALLPGLDWHKPMIEDHWRPGEDGAWARFQAFLNGPIDHYAEGRDIPSENWCSRLSPHLHFGEISPNQVWHGVMTYSDGQGAEAFLREIGWREFSANLLWHFPHMHHQNFRPEFDAFPWQDDDAALRAWQQGRTGIPLVDAGMRELWATGYMHNRVRMVAASFLVKNLMIDWRHGEAWFRDCLVDWDLANNIASWQWVAGSGADAAPYFRIFNPMTQAEKFDATRRYIDRWLPNGTCAPIIDLKSSRARALAAYKGLKEAV